VDWTAAEPTRVPTVGLVAQPKPEAARRQVDTEPDARAALEGQPAGYPLMALLAAVQVAWLFALGYLVVRLLS
jgi:hypothetical protein